MAAMDNTLLVDLGNSSLKWTFLEGGKLGEVNRSPHQRKLLAHQLEQIWGNIQPPETVWVAAVASQSLQDDLRLWIERNWSAPVRFMGTEKSAIGVTCAYHRPGELGVDRWAAILAAYHYHPQGVCVLDCGTAITLDLIHGDGRHLGGYIVPGFELMRQSLFSNTAIEVVEDEQPSGEWGISTASCIALGARKAVASLVESSVERLQAAGVCDPALILTGSSVKEILSMIEIDYEIREQLVLDGLLMYARGKAI
jgi:type III pantothenate kinase